MHLNLPVLDRLMACENLLIAGMGGGYDVFCGLPIYFELRSKGKNVHLANYSFSSIETLRHGIRLTDTLVGVNSEIEGPYPYFPEQHLVTWFRETRGEDVTLWSFHKTGARPLIENYAVLIDHLKIDGILLIDGGVDSLVRGDELELGTLIEDTMSLIAVSRQKRVQTRILCCCALGAELDMTYAHIFENMAALAKVDAFLGSCSLVKAMDAYREYEDAVLYVQNQPMQDSSVINSSLISAVRGEYGNFHLTSKTDGSHLWISPLMPIYWFYELEAVARRNHVMSDLALTDTFIEAFREVVRLRKHLPIRKGVRIPLP